jgi:hypothetical protein
VPVQRHPAGQVQSEPVVGVVQIHGDQFFDSAQPRRYRVAVDAEDRRGVGDRSSGVEVGGERGDEVARLRRQGFE